MTFPEPVLDTEMAQVLLDWLQVPRTALVCCTTVQVAQAEGENERTAIPRKQSVIVVTFRFFTNPFHSYSGNLRGLSAAYSLLDDSQDYGFADGGFFGFEVFEPGATWNPAMVWHFSGTMKRVGS